MKQTLIIKFLVVISVNFLSIECAFERLPGDLVEDDHCSYNGVNGYCKLAAHCSDYFKQQIAKNDIIPICSFKGSESVICCPDNFVQNGVPNGVQQHSGGVIEKYDLSYENCLELYLNSREKVDFLVEPLSVETYEKDFPGIATIGWYGKQSLQWKCTGSIIAPNYVISSKNCLSSMGRIPDIVSLGDVDLKTVDDDVFSMEVEVNQVFPNPDPNVDLALVRLKEDVFFNRYIAPTCLGDSQSTYYIDAISRNEESQKLKKNSLKYIQKCSVNSSPTQFCAEVQNDDISVCSRASSEILQKVNIEEVAGESYSIPVLLGVAFGQPSCQHGVQEPYQNVSRYLDWIEATINGN